MRKFSFLFVVAILLAAGCGSQKETALTEEQLQLRPIASGNMPIASGGFVLSIGGEAITSDEFTEALTKHYELLAQTKDFEQFEAEAGPELERIIRGRISNILLHQKAKEELGDQIDEGLEKAVESDVRGFVSDFGGDYAKAEEKLKKEGYDWKSYREFLKKKMLSEYYISQNLPKDEPITHSELLSFYDDIKAKYFTEPATITFRLIDIQPTTLKGYDPNKSNQQLAEALADELVRRLKDGEDFAELAEQYSHGHRASAGGLWKPVQPTSLAEPYDILAKEAEKIDIGYITGPVKTEGHIFIIKLESRNKGKIESFEEMQGQVEAMVIAERRQRAIEKFSAELFEEAALSDINPFFDYCLKEIYRISNGKT